MLCSFGIGFIRDISDEVCYLINCRPLPDSSWKFVLLGFGASFNVWMIDADS
ncbi:hypothetical protein OAF09_00445 [bacterium]|nr:hypothetical protein [bacterium]